MTTTGSFGSNMTSDILWSNMTSHSIWPNMTSDGVWSNMTSPVIIWPNVTSSSKETNASTTSDVIVAEVTYSQELIARRLARIQYNLRITTIHDWLIRILLPLTVALSLFGNIMTIIIVSRLRQAGMESTMDVYFLSLAVADLITTVFGPLRLLAKTFGDIDINNLNNVVCKISGFAINAGAACSSWILVAMATQRVASVLVPHRVKLLFTRRVNVIVIVIIVVVFTLVYTHFLYGLTLRTMMADGEPKSYCTLVSSEYAKFLYDVWSIVDMVIHSLLPSLCLVVTNIILVVKIRKSMLGEDLREAGREELDAWTDWASRSRIAHSITMTAILVSGAFIVLSLPLGIFNLFHYAVMLRNLLPTVLYLLLFDLVTKVSYLNHAVNFYLYCLTGTRFRTEVRALLCGCRRRGGDGGGGRGGGRGRGQGRRRQGRLPQTPVVRTVSITVIA